MDEKLVAAFEALKSQFDPVSVDKFQGEQMERLMRAFMDEHGSRLRGIPFAWPDARFPGCGPNEALEEDWLVLSSTERELAPERAGQHQQFAANIYRRACQACYLRATINKSNHNQEDDRMEAVELGRHAIRYDPNDFPVCYWYMIALGWQLNALTDAKKRALVARAFRESCLRCIRLDPNDPLAYHLLGRYNYSVANLSWLERTVAKNLLGCKLEGSIQEAERLFRRAHELKDDWLPSGLWLARTSMAQKLPHAETESWIEFGLRLECQEPTSVLEREELLELRSRLKLCQ